MLTDEQLKRIMPNSTAARRQAALPALNSAAQQYEINTEQRMAAWLATLAAESGELKYQEEIASGSAYEGRKDLGNTQKGDGKRFKGHGRIQITGRSNHQAYTNYLKRSGHLPFVDFVAEPSRLAQEPYATDSAGWFWYTHKLNAFADKGDFLTTQVRVNGRNKRTGLPNHWDVRNRYWVKALSVLPDGFSVSALSASHSASTIPNEPANDDADAHADAFADQTRAPIDSSKTSVEQTTVETPDGTATSTTVTSSPTLEMAAPVKDGATATGTKVTILGLAVPPVVLTLVETVKGLIKDGVVDAKEIADNVIKLIVNNQKYVFALVGLIIILLIVKKIIKTVTFWLEMLTHAVPSWTNIKVVAQESEAKPWWKIW